MNVSEGGCTSDRTASCWASITSAKTSRPAPAAPPARRAAGDLVLACLGDKELSGNVINTRLAVRKNRGGQQGQEYPFALRMVEAPEPDEDGEPITTMVVDWQPAPPGGAQPAAGSVGAGPPPRSAHCGAAAEAGADGRPG